MESNKIRVAYCVHALFDNQSSSSNHQSASTVQHMKACTHTAGSYLKMYCGSVDRQSAVMAYLAGS